MDNNVFVRNPFQKKVPLILWSPVQNDSCIIRYDDPSELHAAYPEFAANSKLYNNTSVFKSTELGNYQVLPAFPGINQATVLPDAISKLLNRPKKDMPFVGAYGR
jgi:hypothetical protein